MTTKPPARPTLQRLALACAMAAIACATGCAGSTARDASISDRTGGAIGDSWRVLLPEGYDGWTVQSSRDCALLFAWSTGMEDNKASRVLRCHAPDDGELVWERTIPVPAGFVYDRVHTSGDRIVYQNNQQMVGIDADSGEVVWFFDPGERIIGETHIKGGFVVSSLSQKTLVVLDLDSGEWVRGIAAGKHRFVGVHKDREEGLLAMAVLIGAGPPGARSVLTAIRLECDGGTEPSPPFAKLDKAWEKPFKIDTQDLHLIGDTLVGHLSRGELWGVAPESGEVLYKVPDSGRASPRYGDGLDPDDYDEAPEGLAMIDRSDLAGKRRIAKHHMMVLGHNSAILSQGHRKGVVVQMLEVHARHPRTFEPMWSLQMPSLEFFRNHRELPKIKTTLIAGARFVLLVDSRTGEVLWRRDLDQEARDWTSMATDGRGLFVVYGRDLEPRLEAHPIK